MWDGDESANTADGTGTGTGRGPGSGMMGGGQGGGMMGGGQGGGMMGGVGTLPRGTLTSGQQEVLVSMADEEKLAHDTYVTLGTRFPEVWQFGHIQRAESMHQAAIRSLLARYGISDPTAGLPVGTLATTRMQGLYDELVSGATTSAKALTAGVTVEQTDIADLTKALDGLTAPDVQRVYGMLRNASQRHLAAFGG
jgi:hypothetical protein